jgi:hypothetical protein
VRIGFALPQIGAAAAPDAVTSVARRAEELGFDSVWVLDRLLYPVNPKTPYPVGDGTLPTKYKRVLDPIETLTWAAAQTKRIAVGTSVLNVPGNPPCLRGDSQRSMLSGGRLRSFRNRLVARRIRGGRRDRYQESPRTIASSALKATDNRSCAVRGIP